jgi:hypothetical protein
MEILMAAVDNSSVVLQDCSMPGDRFRLQARMVGEMHWADSTVHLEALPAEWASQLVRELNEVSTVCVYRAVLVEVAHV